MLAARGVMNESGGLAFAYCSHGLPTRQAFGSLACEFIPDDSLAKF
jgi:hypothetical protein